MVCKHVGQPALFSCTGTKDSQILMLWTKLFAKSELSPYLIIPYTLNSRSMFSWNTPCTYGA